jgi:ferric-dicitrate binding protein FerR (iron transport regulator)
MAASIILLIGIGGTLFYLAHPVKTAPEIISGNTDYRDAKLILSNGKTVLLNNKQSKVQFSANGIDILLNDSSGIVQTLEKEGLNQLIVPFGTRTDIILSDGTKVFLNSGSKLEFPPVFKGKSRQVILEGEAYFEVAPDKDKPFYVKTDAFSTKVYGTKFNIQVYKSDDLSNIVLVEGKVSVLPVKEQNSPGILLAPNQKASIAKNDPTFIVTNVEDTDAYTAWVKGYLTFSNEEISAVLKRVARYYNVEIETALPENTEKIYGKLDLKDDLERVLNGIAFISKTKFQRQADKYVFMVDKPE